MAILLMASVLHSCKKDKKQTTTQKVQVKWSVESIIDHEHDPFLDTNITTLGTTADYIDFRTDGKVYSSVDGGQDTSAYALSGDTSIIIVNNGSFTIQSLTDHVLKLYGRADDPSTSSYFEETLNLKK